MPLVAVIGVWATGYLAIEVAVTGDGSFGPLWMNGTRLLLGAVVLLLWRGLAGHSLRLSGARMLRLATVGGLAWTAGSGLQVVGQQGVPSGLTALIMASSPALAVAFAAAWDRRAPTLLQALAVSLGLGGVGLLVGTPSADAAPWALGVLVAASLAWGAASVVESRLPASDSPILDAGWQMFFGGLGLVALAIARGEPLPQPSSSAWLAWAWLGLVCAGLGYPLWLAALRRLPIHVCMTQPTLSPILAVWMSATFLGETLGPRAVPGMVLALAGAAVAGLTRGAKSGEVAPPRGPWPRWRCAGVT